MIQIGRIGFLKKGNGSRQKGNRFNKKVNRSAEKEIGNCWEPSGFFYDLYRYRKKTDTCLRKENDGLVKVNGISKNAHTAAEKPVGFSFASVWKTQNP